MPKTTRDLLKRQIAHAYLAMDRAIIHIDEVAKPFELQHPELSNPLIMLILMLDEGKKVIDKWVYEVWAREGVDYEAWANVPETSKPKARISVTDAAIKRYQQQLLDQTDTPEES